MKKRTAAIVMSLTMCLSPVCETYASDFCSPDDVADTVIIQQEAEIPAEDVMQETEQEEVSDTDAFSSGETAEELPVRTEETTEDITEDIIEVITEESVFSSEAAEEPVTEYTEVPTALASDSITVEAKQWESVSGRFKLKKAGSVPVVNARTVTAEEAPAANMQAETAEIPAEDIFDDVSAVDQEIYFSEIVSENMSEDMTESEGDEVQLTEADVDAAEASVTSGYYTLEDGLVHITTLYKGIAHSGYYLFDKDGYMVTGQIDIKAGTPGVSAAGMNSYFTDKKKAAVYTEFSGKSMTPYTSDLGQQKRKYWLWTGSVFRYYDASGKYISVSELDESSRKNGKYTGYHKIDGEYYCLKKDGTPRVGQITLTVGSDSAGYYFQTAKETGGIPGQMFHDGWKKLQGAKGERWVYYDKGTSVKRNIGKLRENGVIATRLDTKIKGDKIYLLDSRGYILKSTMKKAENGRYYCTDANGVIYRDKLVRYKGSRYYFGTNGKRVTWTNSWRRCPGAGNRYYYFGSTPGKVSEKTGWQKVTNTSGKYIGWFFFNTRGDHYVNKLTSTDYYFAKSGKLAGGIHEVNGKTYFFKRSNESNHYGKMYRNTFIYYKDNWYYASADGALKKSGWKKIDGNWYYFKNFCAVRNTFMKKNGVNGYLDSKGKYTTGWTIVSNAQNKVRYIDPNGNGYVKNTSKWIDGLLYYFDSNGYRINDVTNRYSGPYYVEVDKTNCVMTIYNSSKTVPLKTIRVSVGLPGTPTPSGTYTLRRSARWQSLMGPSWGQYGTHVSGAGQGGIFVHSIASGHANSYALPAGEYNKLGSPASHGCIRTCVADAKWVFDNCNGSTIRIFSGTYKADEAFKGPLGRNALVPLRGAGNFDPTDPAVP